MVYPTTPPSTGPAVTPPPPGARDPSQCAALLVLLIPLAAEPGTPMYLEYAHDLATQRLTPSTRRALGISRTIRTHNVNGTISRTEEMVTLRQIRYLFDETGRCLSELDGGSSAGLGEVSGDLPALADALNTIAESPEPQDGEPNHIRLARLAIDLENTVRRELLQRLLDLLTDASIPPGLPYSGAFAADETALHAWHRPRGRRPRKAKTQPTASGDPEPEADTIDQILEELGGIRSYDRDARWGHKTPTSGDPNEFYFGYSVTAMVRINPTNAGLGAKGPILVDRLIVRPAASPITEPCITAVDSLEATGKPVTELLADRAYSNKVPESWRRPMRERGVNLVFDLHANDRGCLLDPVSGVLWIDGHPYCHDTPVELQNIKRPNRLKVPEDPAIAAARAAKQEARGAAEACEEARQVAQPGPARSRTHHRRPAPQAVHHQAPRREGGPAPHRPGRPRPLQHPDRRTRQVRAQTPRRTRPDGKERYEDPARIGRLRCTNCPKSLFLIGVLLRGQPT